MARLSRIVIPGVAHHVTQRGLVKDHEEGADDEEDEVQREQIAYALKQAEVSTPVAEAIRRMGISEQTFYRWKKVYGGLGVGELRRLKLLEEENRKLKQLVRARSPPSKLR